MITIHLEIADNLYSKLKKLLESLPIGSYQIIEDDLEKLSAQEQQEVYRLNKLIENGDLSEFEDWDNIKDSI